MSEWAHQHTTSPLCVYMDERKESAQIWPCGGCWQLGVKIISSIQWSNNLGLYYSDCPPLYRVAHDETRIERRVGRLAGIFCFFTALGPRIYEISTDKRGRVHAYILYATRLHPLWINHDAKTLGRGWRTTMRFVEHTPIVFIKRFVLNALFYFKRGAICAQQLGYVPLYARTERWEPLDLHSMMRRPRSKYLLNYSNQRPLRCAWDHITLNMSSFPTQ